MAGIYIHVPFCKTRCIYCDFYSTTRSEWKGRYIEALCKELVSAAVALSQSRLPALLALVALALGQAYFGLSLPAAAQLLLLFMLGLKLVPSRSAVQRLTLGACALAVALVVCLAFPGVHAATEAASERARDFLSGASLSELVDAAVPPEATQTRRENHLSLSTGGGGAVSERDYRLVTRAEEQISDPPWFDALKTALMLALVVLLLALTGAQLTLPGVAGIILGIGMAVDANVVIFERIREEVKNGRPIGSAVRKGFSNALSAIIDSNVTTIIAAVVLYAFGTGSVRGFALTLGIGVATSLVTAVFVTHKLLDIFADLGIKNQKLYV